MFLPSVAERHRRTVLVTIGVSVLVLHAFVRLPGFDLVDRLLVAPVSEVTQPLAAWVVQRVSPGEQDRMAPSPASGALIVAEREAGQPASVAGVAWLEVPVGRAEAGQHRLLLAAGADFGLAPGMPVVYADSWLGRIGGTGPTTAEVDLVSGAARRTPIYLLGDRGQPLRAILQGRGGQHRPLIRDHEAKGEPVEGVVVSFRRGAEDPPPYAQLDMRLGTVVRVGDPQRGSAAWEVDYQLPAGAEGRVYVAAGAVTESVVAEPPVRTGPTSVTLRADGVFGARLCALRAPIDVPPAVATVDDRVLGRIVAQRGSLLWCSLRAPASWPGNSWVGLDGNTATRGDAELRFTAGGAGVPRGLFLGARTDPTPRPVGQLQVWGRVPLREPELTP
ncbi:MAG: hypothetical protein MK209_03910 [Planctomycetes bacterium]|nr:hypothetical protein [Planctomycetota bacterium]